MTAYSVTTDRLLGRIALPALIWRGTEDAFAEAIKAEATTMAHELWELRAQLLKRAAVSG